MTDINNDKKPLSRTPGWVRILLIVSLALNLLIIGLVGGAMMRFGGPDGMRPPPRSIGAVLYRALPGEDRRALWSSSHRAHGGNPGQRKAQILAVTEALRATPFDPGAIETALETHALELDKVQKSLQQNWLTRVQEMSDEQRQAYADRLEKPAKRSWFRRRPRER